ncbi:hypothetical protein K435DRAFT_663701 [Dendrothele bispora CBS 962.96]|uniref:DUF6699 domain-containing protein n=1 Tax=Dendrothele bispora (strain CBS 962.96) TaxID=1314807 RepID=A0A4S8M494_DENBC|nr:hypothetical protein K435DRAFT_663701 [Dendrothele bispora CBS 962.96]
MGSGHSNRNGTSPTGARANNAGGGGGGGGGGGNGNSSHGNSTSPPNFIPPGNHNSRVQSQASTQLTPPRLQWLPTPYPSPYPIPYTQLTSPHGPILPNTPLTPNPDPRFPGLAWEPGVWPPVPLGHPIPIRVHHHLLPNTVQLDLPVLQWDITQLPEKARVLTGKCLLVRPNLEEPAVIYKVWIGSDDPTLGWWMTNMWGPLIIEKERGKEVSVWDVLEGIYRYLAKPLTHWDYEKVVGNEGGGWARDREPVPEGVPNAGEVAMVSYDYRRSDVLGSMKKFVGLRSMVQDDGTWMLYLGLASGGMVKV